VHTQLREAGVTLHRDLPDGLPMLFVDRLGVEQALSNLLLNAAHAAGPGGEIHLSARAVDEWCEFVVEDTGPGISPERLPRIFEPFYTDRAAGEGMGLGLSAALGVVEQHRGTLRAGSSALHGGACMVMALPSHWNGMDDERELTREAAV
ncbi:MAG TPA: ATP-binding protein, partial [Longimicrobiaceae bacterium]|nr:ATP-binding protein [Longimicrobiaceae bacterium]